MGAKSDISKVLRGLGEARKRGLAAALRAVNIAGEHIIGQAQQLAPVDTGALQASATTEPATETRDGVNKVIGFNTDYAAAVHERLDVHHEKGQAKFLETALRRNAEKLPKFVADEVRKALS